jgi:hypothetical protein
VKKAVNKISWPLSMAPKSKQDTGRAGFIRQKGGRGEGGKMASSIKVKVASSSDFFLS